MEEKNEQQESSEHIEQKPKHRYTEPDDDFQTTYFPRRDRSDTTYYGQHRQKPRQTTQVPKTEKRETTIPKTEKLEYTYLPTAKNQTEPSAYTYLPTAKNQTEAEEVLSKTQHTRISNKHIEPQHSEKQIRKEEHTTKSGRTNKKRKRKRKMTKKFKAILVLVIAVAVCFSCFWFAKSLMMTDGSTDNLTGQTVSVTIPNGASTKDIAKILKENDLISNTFTFRLSSKINGYDGTYQQGNYDVDTGMTNTQIMALLQTGTVQNKNKITIPEGFTVKQIAQRVEEKGICSADAFLQEVNNGTFPHAFLKDLPKREYRLEGYLFPDTYFLTDDMTAHDLISMMLDRFDQMYTKTYQDAVAESGHTLDEIVTVASMVEKEISLDEERAKAAGVMYNRLQQDMSLGIDATVLYALGRTGGELTKADLETDSPYNTRLHKGLPLGPIANPGEASFKAALYPDKNEYLYYVVEAQGKSNHVFCKTNEEFLAAKEKYKASLTQ